jgi:hypothetical protein
MSDIILSKNERKFLHLRLLDLLIFIGGGDKQIAKCDAELVRKSHNFD